MQLGASLESSESDNPTNRQNLYSEDNLAKKTEGDKWKTNSDRMRQKEEKGINVKNENYGPMETDPGPGSSGMENDIRPILETDFSYTYSPIVHGPKWYPTMVRHTACMMVVVMLIIFGICSSGWRHSTARRVGIWMGSMGSTMLAIGR